MTINHLIQRAGRSGAISALLFAGLLFVGQTPAEAQTQPERREAFMIHVFDDAGVCRYEIQDYPDQDVFVIEPHGWISFYATGTGARIDAMPDQASNQATDGASGLKIKDGDQPKNLRARPRGAGRTEHDVSVKCCDPKMFGRCVNERDAEPVESPTGHLMPLMTPLHLAETEGFAFWGVGTAIPIPSHPMPAGGPRMIVED